MVKMNETHSRQLRLLPWASSSQRLFFPLKRLEKQERRSKPRKICTSLEHFLGLRLKTNSLTVRPWAPFLSLSNAWSGLERLFLTAVPLTVSWAITSPILDHMLFPLVKEVINRREEEIILNLSGFAQSLRFSCHLIGESLRQLLQSLETQSQEPSLKWRPDFTKTVCPRSPKTVFLLTGVLLSPAGVPLS